MKKLCPECHFIGEGKYYDWVYKWFLANITIGIALVLAIVLVIIEKFILKEPDITFDPLWIGFLFIIMYFLVLGLPLLWGIINIKNYFQGGKMCPKCSYTQMLQLKNPDAVKIIKENNLQVSK